MFIHTVLMRLSDDVDDAFHRKVDDYVSRVRTELACVCQYFYGRNLADRANGLTWAVVGMFDSSADHDRYQVSAVHQEMKAYMSPFIVEIIACDMECDR
jgi:hypothetical protein